MLGTVAGHWFDQGLPSWLWFGRIRDYLPTWRFGIEGGLLQRKV